MWKEHLGKYLVVIDMSVPPTQLSNDTVNFKIQIYFILMRKRLYETCLYLQDSNTLTDLVSILML